MELKRTRRQFVRELTTAAGVATGTSLAGCLGIVTSDRARYFSVSERSVEGFDYDATKAAGEDAGYAVDGPYYGSQKDPTVGFHPDGIDELDARFGADYRVDHVVFHYSLTTRVRAWFGPDSEVSILDDRAWTGPDPFRPEYLPEETWLVERLTLLFDIEPARAREYVAQLEDAITSEKTDVPSIDVSEAATFGAVYRNLRRESTGTEGTHSQGEGWHVVTYYRDDDPAPLAEVGYQLQSTKVVHERGKATYVVQFDPLGAVRLEITLPAGESIPDEERRSTFREMFDALGLPPELVDGVEFEYVGSMW